MITTIGLVTGEEIRTQKWSVEQDAIGEWLRSLRLIRTELIELREMDGKRQLVMIAPHAIAWMRFG